MFIRLSMAVTLITSLFGDTNSGTIFYSLHPNSLHRKLYVIPKILESQSISKLTKIIEKLKRLMTSSIYTMKIYLIKKSNDT